MASAPNDCAEGTIFAPEPHGAPSIGRQQESGIEGIIFLGGLKMLDRRQVIQAIVATVPLGAAVGCDSNDSAKARNVGVNTKVPGLLFPRLAPTTPLSYINDIHFSPDGSLLISGKALFKLDLNSGRIDMLAESVSGTGRLPSAYLMEISTDTSGERIAILQHHGGGSQLSILSLTGGPPGRRDNITKSIGFVPGSIAMYPDGNDLLVAGGYGSRGLLKWNIGSRTIVSSAPVLIEKLSVGRSGSPVFGVSGSTTLLAWQGSKLTKMETLSEIFSYEYLPSRNSVLIANGRGGCGFWDLASGRLIEMLSFGETEIVSAVARSSAVPLVAAAVSSANAERVNILDLDGKSLTHFPLSKDGERIVSLTFSGDGKWLAARKTGISTPGSVFLWKLQEPDEQAKISLLSEEGDVLLNLPGGAYYVTERRVGDLAVLDFGKKLPVPLKYEESYRSKVWPLRD